MQQKPEEKEIIVNSSEVLSSNVSSLSKRTFMGIKGAVKPAFRNKSI